jgi:hypothetical protein
LGAAAAAAVSAAVEEAQAPMVEQGEVALTGMGVPQELLTAVAVAVAALMVEPRYLAPPVEPETEVTVLAAMEVMAALEAQEEQEALVVLVEAVVVVLLDLPMEILE